MRIRDGEIITKGNVTTVIDYNDKDQFRTRQYEDITELLKFNHEMRKDENHQNGFSADRELRWIGRIPQATFIEHYQKYPEARDPNGTYWAEFLKKSENEPFRTVPHILGGATKFL